MDYRSCCLRVVIKKYDCTFQIAEKKLALSVAKYYRIINYNYIKSLITTTI
uniref:Uncharacterized protein n=1 Tax=Anguilla anguilla TaxID=7936 RepID=A0A0E9RKJ6_ANGAN